MISIRPSCLTQRPIALVFQRPCTFSLLPRDRKNGREGSNVDQTGSYLSTNGRLNKIFAGGNDAVDSWLDLASFVAASKSRTPFDELAESIGRECYIDIAGWHLFLKDVKVSDVEVSLAQALAQMIGQEMATNGFDERNVEDGLRKIPINVGKGKVTITLLEAMPHICVSDLMKICSDYERSL